VAYDDFSIPTPTYRVPQGRGMDAGTRRLAFIAAGLGAALLAIVGGYSAMHRHHGGAVPVVTADKGPTRFKPDNPGGMDVAGAGNDVFSGGSDTDVDKLAPPPETPAPQPRTAPVTAPAQATAAPLVAPAAEPVKPAAKPAVVASPVKPAAVASAAKPAAAAQVAAKPAAVASTPAKPAAAAAASAKPTTVATTSAAANTAGTTTAGTKPDKTGKAAVQLAAFPTEDAAKAEWARLQKQMPDVFGGRQPALSKTERDGRTWWRLRTGGFADPTQAIQFCEHVRAKGATCSVADF
jgi:cell division septation protein DedD